MRYINFTGRFNTCGLLKICQQLLMADLRDCPCQGFERKTESDRLESITIARKLLGKIGLKLLSQLKVREC
ncbi:MAG: hypothetical protein ACYTXI_04230 [Nostoc sp.]